MGKQIEVQQKPNRENIPRPDFDKSYFESAIYDKGYEVVYEKALRCPCKDKDRPGFLSSCLNCGGTGWIWINPVKTKMILHTMNMPTQYRPWSIENIGTVSITTRDIDLLGYMDKITLPKDCVVFSQIMFPKSFGNQLFGFTIYKLKEVLQIFKFVAADQPLELLTEGAHYTYVEGDNKILFNEDFATVENFTVTVRYKHPLQFYAIDFPREMMSTNILNTTTGYDERTPMPVHAIGRRIHIVLDAENYQGAILFDNSIVK